MIRRRDGSAFPAWLMISAVREANGNAVSHYIATMHRHQRPQAERGADPLPRRSTTSLTELPNRALCIERLRWRCSRPSGAARRSRCCSSTSTASRTINDSLGHHVGDGLLRSVASACVASVRAVDTVSRLGGDEFVVILNGVADVDEIRCDRRRAPVPDGRAQPHVVDGAGSSHVSCSVGIAIYPDDARDIDTLMRHADAAMYQAKAQRPRRRALLHAGAERARAEPAADRSRTCAMRSSAASCSLHFQPRVDARSRALLGVEALLRWNIAGARARSRRPIHPDRRGDRADRRRSAPGSSTRPAASIGPGAAPASTSRGVGQRLGDAGARPARCSRRCASRCARHAMPPGSLELELTETTLMDSADETPASSCTRSSASASSCRSTTSAPATRA